MNDELNQYYNTCMIICAPLLAWCWWQVFNYWSKGVLGMGISIYLNSRFTGIIAHPYFLCWPIDNDWCITSNPHLISVDTCQKEVLLSMFCCPAIATSWCWLFAICLSWTYKM